MFSETRQAFEEATKDLVDRTRFTTKQTLRAASLEWKTQSPPIQFNFEETPVAHYPYDFTTNEWDPELGDYVDRGPAATQGA